VSAPWGVELDENVLVVVNDLSLVVVGDDDGDGALLLLGNGLRLDAWVDLSGDEIIHERCDLRGGERAGVRELLVLVRLLDGESGELAGLEVEVSSVLSEGLGVNGREVDGALVLGSEGL
jgi:hypothetical protein